MERANKIKRIRDMQQMMDVMITGKTITRIDPMDYYEESKDQL